MPVQITDFYNLYQLELEQFEAEKKAKKPLWLLLFQATGVFFVTTFIVFFVANYQFIKHQLLDWSNGKTQAGHLISDSDGDGMPDWWELKYSLKLGFRDDQSDDDQDGLGNYLEYVYMADPTNRDSDADGIGDGDEIANGFNPNGKGKADADWDGMPDWWEEKFGTDKFSKNDAVEDLDGDGVGNLEEFLAKTDPGNKNDGMKAREQLLTAAYVGAKRGLVLERDSDQDGLTDSQEDFWGLDALNADGDGDGFGDGAELSRGYDPSGDGLIGAKISIPSIEVVAPLTWSQDSDEEKIQEDLMGGVIHFPGTAFPGMRGNSYITGHSSYYAWSKSAYKDIFKNLGGVQTGDDVVVHLEFKSGKKADMTYSVVAKEVVEAADPRLFRGYEGHEITVVTCWPVGSDSKRLMIKAELVRPDWK